MRHLTMLLSAGILSLSFACASAPTPAPEVSPANIQPDSESPFRSPTPLPELPQAIEVETTAGAATPTSTSISGEALDGFLQHGPRYVLSLVQVKPAFLAGRFVGYEVTGLSVEGQKILGGALKSGDVVIAVNNHRVARPADYMKAWEALKVASSLSVKVRRQGNDVEMSWPIERTERVKIEASK